MLKALSTLDRKVDYVSDADPAKGAPGEAEDATVFELSPLSTRQLAEIQDSTMTMSNLPGQPDAEMEVRIHANKRAYLLCQAGLRGWRNFPGADGHDAAFATESRLLGGTRVPMAAPAAMDRLSLDLIVEIANRVQEISTLGDETAKN